MRGPLGGPHAARPEARMRASAAACMHAAEHARMLAVQPVGSTLSRRRPLAYDPRCQQGRVRRRGGEPKWMRS